MHNIEKKMKEVTKDIIVRHLSTKCYPEHAYFSKS